MSVSGISNHNAYIVTGDVRLLTEISPSAARKLSPSEIAALDARINPNPEVKPADNSPENLYAEITVGGKVVAKVWSTGIAQVPNSYSGELSMSGGGESLARKRAEQIAETLGGRINYTQNASSYSFSESLERLLST